MHHTHGTLKRPPDGAVQGAAASCIRRRSRTGSGAREKPAKIPAARMRQRTAEAPRCENIGAVMAADRKENSA